MPAVSVIVPFHRTDTFLRASAESVLRQTLEDFELLVVDNGTGLGLAPAGLAAGDPRTRLIALRSNEGAAGGRNAALAQARGEFVAFLDSDDVALPRRLERQIALLRSNACLGMVSSRVDTIDPRAEKIGREFTIHSGSDQFVFSAYTMPAPLSSLTGRREIFDRISFRSELEAAEDFDLFARVAESWRLGSVDETLTEYRVHPGQTTGVRYAAQVFDASVVRLTTARRRSGREEGLPALRDEFREWFASAPALSVTYETFARRCLEENFGALAVYHARRLVSSSRRVRTLRHAAGILMRAVRLEPREAGFLGRLFFTGPLRTHGLRPA